MAEGVVFATIFLAGLAAGSFLNVVIHRGPVLWGLIDQPTRGDLATPRSYCPACRTRLSAVNLIPLVSYAVQRGRCTTCGAKISPRYPIVEFMGGASALLAVTIFGLTPAAALATIFMLALIALAFIDLETGYLPDAITLPLVALGLVANFFGSFASLATAASGAAAGYVIFGLISLAYRRLRSREGLGLGDAKLLAAIGAWTGWMGLPFVVFFAALVTLATMGAMALIERRTAYDQPVPFGPGLCAAGAATLLFSERLISVL